MSLRPSSNRRGTGSIKWDRRPELDPYWVADMDFESAPAILDAIVERTRHGVFGYSMAHAGLVEAILSYLAERHGYAASEDSLVHLGGLVPALSLAARAFGESGDELVTCTPVYPPFLGVARDAGMETIRVPHRRSESGIWTFDWEALERAIGPRSRVFLLCSPQNPLGRCFGEAEITRLARLCQEHGLILVADEVHCDLVLDEEKTPFFSALRLPHDLRQHTIVLHSPSKTYNIAGMGYAFAVIENADLRRRFQSARGHTMAEINCLAFYAAEAAYRFAESWRRDLISALTSNRNRLLEFAAAKLPGIRIPDIEATYLAWMDCNALGLEDPARHLEQAGLFLSDGVAFGCPGCVRFNFGCSESRMMQGLHAIEAALYDPRVNP